MADENIFEVQAAVCHALDLPTGMQIMHLLRDGPLNVNDIAWAANTRQTTISRNLAILRNAGIVTTHREGTSISNLRLMSICDLMREVLSEQINDRSNLLNMDKAADIHAKGG